MENKLLKPGRRQEKLDKSSNKVDSAADLAELQRMAESVSAGVNTLSEGIEEDGVFSEDGKKAPGDSTAGGKGDVGRSAKSKIKALPSIEVMIEQTVMAIKNELKNTESEVKMMIRSKKTSPHMLNNKVRRIRFLNDLLGQLKRTAKLAEDFVIGLWKQFSGKSS